MGPLGALLGLVEALHWLRRRPGRAPYRPNGALRGAPKGSQDIPETDFRRTIVPVSLRTDPFCTGINIVCRTAVPTQQDFQVVFRKRDHATTPGTLFEHSKNCSNI